MQTRNRFFDDLARVAGGAAGTISELRGEIESLVRQRVERVANDLNLVSREEFDVVQAVATKARAEQERLEKRVEALEAALSAQKSPATPRKRAAPVNKARKKS